MLFEAGFGDVLPQFFAISRHDDRRQLSQGEMVRLIPAGELCGVAGIGRAGMAIVDIGGCHGPRSLAAIWTNAAKLPGAVPRRSFQPFAAI
jgi:hypothetical protein